MCRYQDRGLPFCYVGYFDGMEEGTLRANVIEAKVNNVAVRYERPRNGESDNEIYSQGEVVPAEKIISAAGFKVRPCCWCSVYACFVFVQSSRHVLLLA
jgi:hypothetical protein